MGEHGRNGVWWSVLGSVYFSRVSRLCARYFLETGDN